MNTAEPTRSAEASRSPGASAQRAAVPPASGQGQELRLLALAPGEQRRTIVELLRRGKSDAEIGALFRLSHWQVRNLRYRLGIKKDRGGHVRLVPSRADAGGMEAGLGAGVGAGMDRGAPSLGLRLAGRFEGGELARRLAALAGLCEATQGEFRIELMVQQSPLEQQGFGD